jgi:Zn-dependent peptidase ImmA (M78 family)
VSSRIELGRSAARSALQLRRSLSISRESVVNVYDVAEALGVEVHFVNGPSLEGMFARDPHPCVFLPSMSHRPRGRVSFSCAHELGHFQLGHGTRVDEYIEGDVESLVRSDDEFAADTFAATLLMARQAVLNRFSIRSLAPRDATPVTLFEIAGELDVGYSTLIRHLRYRLEVVDASWLTNRSRVSPKTIRENLLGVAHAKRLLLVDKYWPSTPIDVEIGDVIGLPRDASIEVPRSLSEAGVFSSWRSFVPTMSGHFQVRISGDTHAIRVARTGYCGKLKYRFIEDPEAT